MNLLIDADSALRFPVLPVCRTPPEKAELVSRRRLSGPSANTFVTPGTPAEGARAGIIAESPTMMNEEDAGDLTKIESAGPKSLPTSTDALFGTHRVAVATWSAAALPVD